MLLIIVMIGVIFFITTARRVVTDTCISEVNAKINDVINGSNDVMLTKEVFYADYFSFSYDNEKNVTAIVANTGLINQMTLLWNTEIQNRLNELRTIPIVVSTGLLTGNAILAQYGQEIEIDAQIVSNCAITYESKLYRSGINNTLHKLVLNTEITAQVLVPVRTENVIVSQEIVLAETVIPGVVPQSYLVGDNSVGYLDLLP